MLPLLKKYYGEITNFFYKNNSQAIPSTNKHEGYKILQKDFAEVIKKEKNPKWLDLGCGQCWNTEDLLAVPDLNLYGIDIAEAGFKNAKKIEKDKLRKGSVDELTGKELSFRENEFNFLSSVFTFSFLSPDIRFASISEIHKVLKKGGKFFLLEFLNPSPALVQMPFQQMSAQMMIGKDQVMLPIFALSSEVYKEYFANGFKFLKEKEVLIKLGKLDAKCILMAWEKV